MREICSDTSLGVPKGKRVQRQVRYERLKEEFLKLVTNLGEGMSNQGAGSKDDQMNYLKTQLETERSDFQQKIGLYKD